jgi:hypothetical protein
MFRTAMVPPKLLHNGGIIGDLSRPLLAPKHFRKCLRSCSPATSESFLSPVPEETAKATTTPPLLTCIGQRCMSLSWRRREISHSQLRADSRKLEWQYAVNRNQNLTIQRPVYLPDLSLNLAPALEVDLGAESLHNCGFFQRALLLPQNSESPGNSLSARQLRSAPESGPRSSGFVDFVDGFDEL